MKKYVQFALLAGLVVGLASIPVLAGQNQQPSSQPAQAASGTQATPATPAAGAAQPATAKPDPAEQKAYQAFYTIPPSDPQQIASSGAAFVKKYPNSVYNAAVYARLAATYETLGDATKMFDAGHKALALNPNNVDVLSLMAYAIPRRINPNDLETPQKLAEATQDADHALALLGKMQKPASLTQQQFTTAVNGESAYCHSGLGLVDYYQHNIPGMVSEFEEAVKLDPTPEPSDQYLLGLAYLQDNRPADAATVLKECSTESGPLQSRCQSSLAQAKKLAAAKAPAKQ